MRLFSYEPHYSLSELRQDLATATEGWDWLLSAYGHSLSLPSREALHPLGREHGNNLPFAAALEKCPYFAGIFDSFACPKVSFRLLRRKPGSAYAWHTDRDKGENVVRFQIPIVTSESSQLVVTDYDDYDEFKGLDRRLSEEEAFERFDLFRETDRGHYELHVLEPGVLYYFNTSRFHTLVNRGNEERISLVMDFLANDWLRAKYAEIEAELAPAVR